MQYRRPRRNRKSASVRELVEETSLSTKDLIFPLFLIDGQKKKIEVDSMPGIYRFSIDEMLLEIESCLKLGIQAFDVFSGLSGVIKRPICKGKLQSGDILPSRPSCDQKGVS